MIIPIENRIAAFPPSVRAGNVVLRPLTIGGAIRLAAIGVDVTKTPVPRDRLFAAAFVLSGEGKNGEAISRSLDQKRYLRFLRRARCGLKELANAVEEVINAAFSTHIPPRPDDRAPQSFTPSGLGWPLVLAEAMCAEYGMGFDAALEMPLCRVFALQAAARIRNGGEHGGPDYIERTLDIVKGTN